MSIVAVLRAATCGAARASDTRRASQRSIKAFTKLQAEAAKFRVGCAFAPQLIKELRVTLRIGAGLRINKSIMVAVARLKGCAVVIPYDQCLPAPLWMSRQAMQFDA